MSTLLNGGVEKKKAYTTTIIL